LKDLHDHRQSQFRPVPTMGVQACQLKSAQEYWLEVREESCPEPAATQVRSVEIHAPLGFRGSKRQVPVEKKRQSLSPEK
jgi:hypothetical protein